MSEIILVRHTEISSAWKKRCYGVSDVPLSDAGKAAIAPIAKRLANHYAPCRVIHSGLSRTKMLASAIASQIDSQPTEDTAFKELNFGSWEGRLWTHIFVEVGHGMARLITEPDTFSPPNGETVLAVRNRVIRALLKIPRTGVTIIVTHGGPIGAVRGTLHENPVKDWPGLVPNYGTSLALRQADLSKLRDVMRPELSPLKGDDL